MNSLIDNADQNKVISLKDVADILKRRSEKANILSDLKGLAGEINPFTSWNERGVMVKDLKMEQGCVEELLKAVDGSKVARPILQLISLAAKNRAESLSEKSDFYPASVSFLTAYFGALAVISFDASFVKLACGIGAASIILLFLSVRLSTRRQVANLKTIANIADLAEKLLPK